MYEIKGKYNSKSNAYELIRNIDKDVQTIRNDLYILRHENNSQFLKIHNTLEQNEKSISELKQNNAVLQNNVAELRNDVKELQRSFSDIKGDIKALTAGFGAAQNRFNWGLVILGIIVALIQLLK